MKFRSGFVSNSSSSSFCIYGTFIGDGEFDEDEDNDDFYEKTFQTIKYNLVNFP